MGKKIILIDDNSHNQRRDYGAGFVDDGEFDDILTHFERFSASDNFDFLKDADCLLLHDSLEDFINGEFVEKSHKARQLIEGSINDNCKVVIFSDGHTIVDYNPFIDKNINAIKKSDFYNRLKIFLQMVRNTGEIKLELLAYGANANEEIVNTCVRNIISSIANLAEEDVIAFNKIDKLAFKRLVDMCQPELGITFNDIIDDIEDSEITKSHFIDKINRISESFRIYGKNIYTW